MLLRVCGLDVVRDGNQVVSFLRLGFDARKASNFAQDDIFKNSYREHEGFSC